MQNRTMDKLVLVSCAVILIGNFCFEVILASQRFDTPVEKKMREEDGKISPVWFSPRLGRRKRNTKDEVYRPTEQDLAALLEAFEDSPLALVAVNGNEKLVCKNVQGKRSSFTPRLGRNVEDDISGNDKWLQDNDGSAEYMIQRSPPFAPRLGRRSSPYSPRLVQEQWRIQSIRNGGRE